MEGRYKDAIANASAILAEAMLEHTGELMDEGRQLDAEVRRTLFDVGATLMTVLFRRVGKDVVEKAKQDGMTVERRKTVTFKTLFGPIEVDSPYLYDRQEARGLRPMREHFGIEGNSYSDAVERALTDFGSEKSFARAEVMFEEHYGFNVGRTTILRLTKRLGEEAEKYLAKRYAEGERRYAKSDATAPKVDEVFVGLDGSMLRTGELMTAKEAARRTDDPNRRAHYEAEEPDKVVRLEQWKEVRIGFARKHEEVNRIYVGARADYETLCHQLFQSAGLKGLGPDTQVIGLGDGGLGLKEGMEMCFAKLQYILDPPHLLQHLHETARALDMADEEMTSWVDALYERMAGGEAMAVVAELESTLHTLPHPDEDEVDEDGGYRRLRQLIGYLTRFLYCVHYDEYCAKDWTIGSGEVEAAHRFIPQERMKIPGACWHEDTLNPMLALRTIRANQWWGDFWEDESKRRAA